MGKILPGPWAKQQKEQMAFPRLSEDSPQDLCFFIAEIQQALQGVSRPFKRHNDIYPVHCKEALKVVGCLNEELTIVCQKLCRSASLAIMFSPARYPLLSNLYSIQEDISRLMEQLSEYRISCLKSSRRLYSRQREIVTLLDKIMRQLEDVPDLLVFLEKDIKVQSQRLCSVASIVPTE